MDFLKYLISDISLESSLIDSLNITSINDLNHYMKGISYSEFTKLKTPKELVESKSGSCHDQTAFELYILNKLGIKSGALFLLEYNSKTNQGGMTHSFVYYIDNGHYYWFENAWEDFRGIHKFSSLSEIKKEILLMHKNKKFGNNKIYDSIEFSSFKYKYGDSLQELVDRNLK